MTISRVPFALRFTDILFVLLLALFVGCRAAPSLAQPMAAPPAEKLQQLMKLMDDPEISRWIQDQSNIDKPALYAWNQNRIEQWESRVLLNLRSAAAGLPKLLPNYVAASTRVRAELLAQGMAPGVVILFLILLAAIGGDWILRRMTYLSRTDSALMATTAREALAALAFVAITVIFFFAAEWPPMLRAVLRSYLLAAIAFRLVIAVTRILVAAGGLSSVIYRRTLLFFGVLFLGLATVRLTVPLNVDPEAAQAMIFIASIVLALISIEAVWRQDSLDSTAQGSFRTKVFQTVCLLAIWAIWALGLHLLCWIGLFALFLPKFLNSIDHLARTSANIRWPGESHGSLRAVLTIHGLRTFALGAAAGWLAYVWSTTPLNGTSPGSFGDTVVSGLIKSAAVLFIADFGWRVCKALIERKLTSVSGDEPLTPEEASRRARIRTLLPIFRNALAAVVLLVTILTVLAELGVEIGPLVAGAGIFGVAIGFGSQTLVKDVISGVFYLMDDAFRVGEYIQSGSYMGTVESFSLRSVRLRHHRGPVFTVPFGELGAVQNMSRDWVIDKFRLRVTFDADIAKVKQLTKAVGAELLADQDVGPLIIETVKMKGVEQINEYGVELGFAFRAKPGNQATIRRRAYAMIRKAFVENGINFAQPMVQVGGDEKSGAAAAAALTLIEQRKQAEALAAAGQKKA